MSGKARKQGGMDVQKMNLSLAGCGYLGIYHVGVGACMRRYLPQVFRNKLSGASVGALVAAAFICDVPLEQCTMSVINVVLQVRHAILGPITPDLDIMTLLYENMACILPEDAHLYCNGRLHISVTRYQDYENVLLSHFDSKEDLLQALMCSCFIPVYCGFDPPKFHGVAYVDGGYSNNCPRLDAHTITVAPFDGVTVICPKDKTGGKNLVLNGTSIFFTLENIRRILRVLFPGPPEMMKELCQKGFNDALLFLRNNGFIQCPECNPIINEKLLRNNADHGKCKPMEYPMPPEIGTEIDAAVERLQRGIGHRLLQIPLVKMLYYVNIPSIYTAKISYSLLSAIARKLQNKTTLCQSSLHGSNGQSRVVHHSKPKNSTASSRDAKPNNGNKLSSEPMETISVEINEYGSSAFFCDDEEILRLNLNGTESHVIASTTEQPVICHATRS